MKIVYVTGCDASFFLMTGILLEAFKERCPGRTLLVCDFGLSDQQRALLDASGILLPRPAVLPANRHPWFYKSAIGRYLESLQADIVVWLDSDCFPVGPFADEVDRITASWGESAEAVALCRGKVGKTWGLASPPEARAHYRMAASYPYYNSGVWILRSQKVLEEWPREVERAPKTGMYEQDAFNYLLVKHTLTVHALNNDIFNVTHDSLTRVTINERGNVALHNTEPMILHLTGAYTPLNVAIGPFSGVIRAMTPPRIREIQLQLLTRWVVSLTAK